MRPAVRRVLFIAAGSLATLALDALAKGRGRRRLVRGVLDFVRPKNVTDDTLAARVRSALARSATAPELIQVTIEHGCVELRGPIPTRERPHVVRAIAGVQGVDSVIDLMTEPKKPRALGAGTAASMRHGARRLGAKAGLLDGGLGLALAALAVRQLLRGGA